MRVKVNYVYSPLYIRVDFEIHSNMQEVHDGLSRAPSVRKESVRLFSKIIVSKSARHLILAQLAFQLLLVAGCGKTAQCNRDEECPDGYTCTNGKCELKPCTSPKISVNQRI